MSRNRATSGPYDNVPAPRLTPRQTTDRKASLSRRLISGEVPREFWANAEADLWRLSRTARSTNLTMLPVEPVSHFFAGDASTAHDPRM